MCIRKKKKEREIDGYRVGERGRERVRAKMEQSGLKRQIVSKNVLS